MGRYYYGDIEGKFWFAVQSSDAADRFGVLGVQPEILNYFYQEDDLDLVEDEILEIEKTIGDYFEPMKKFFDEHDFYNDEELADYLDLPKDRASFLLHEYADWKLGCKIRDQIIEHGECEFTAELM